eukprot:gnl/TRDRNA2_/TRDRNA2_94677_c0_seq1.p1 gnl/TRDRNA2_/TRDRNA2_94677_c0~~gnl/TRDRNA2_/TRDRNA2_94677_c0_seq1.p1  ORF type:complete len:107 (+),score=17.94 gnl/TRDRNA2_/TRDRNA2_94677_c0_seq1:120-440(+)
MLVLTTVHNVGRFYKNHVTKEVADIEKKTPGDFTKLAHLMTGRRTYASLHENGDPDDSAWTCGMAAGFITDIPTVKEFIDRMVDTAETTITERLSGLVVKAPASRL